MNLNFLMHSIKDDWGIDDVVVSEIEADRYGEGDALSWWLAMLRLSEPGATFIDIGAYTGLYSLIAAAARADTRTLALEASVLTHGRLVQNILINKFDMRILPCHVAASETREIVELGHAYGPLSMASGESLVPDYEIDHSELVPAIKVDDLIFQEQSRPFGAVASRALGILPISSLGGVKIDVEGVELSVLNGANRLLKTFLPHLIVEILDHQRFLECEALLTSNGYQRLAVCPGQNYVYSHGSKADLLRQEHEQLRSTIQPTFNIAPFLAYQV
jgi:FkbM family methyltransferase